MPEPETDPFDNTIIIPSRRPELPVDLNDTASLQTMFAATVPLPASGTDSSDRVQLKSWVPTYVGAAVDAIIGSKELRPLFPTRASFVRWSVDVGLEVARRIATQIAHDAINHDDIRALLILENIKGINGARARVLHTAYAEASELMKTVSVLCRMGELSRAAVEIEQFADHIRQMEADDYERLVIKALAQTDESKHDLVHLLNEGVLTDPWLLDWLDTLDVVKKIDCPDCDGQSAGRFDCDLCHSEGSIWTV